MSLTDGPSNDLDHCTEPLPHLESGIPGSRTAEVKVVVEVLIPPLLVFCAQNFAIRCIDHHSLRSPSRQDLPSESGRITCAEIF